MPGQVTARGGDFDGEPPGRVEWKMKRLRRFEDLTVPTNLFRSGRFRRVGQPPHYKNITDKSGSIRNPAQNARPEKRKRGRSACSCWCADPSPPNHPKLRNKRRKRSKARVSRSRKLKLRFKARRNLIFLGRYSETVFHLNYLMRSPPQSHKRTNPLSIRETSETCQALTLASFHFWMRTGLRLCLEMHKNVDLKFRFFHPFEILQLTTSAIFLNN